MNNLTTVMGLHATILGKVMVLASEDRLAGFLAIYFKYMYFIHIFIGNNIYVQNNYVRNNLLIYF